MIPAEPHFGHESPAHHVYELLDDIEAQAGAFLGRGLADLDEYVEDASLIFRGDPDPCVLHFKKQPHTAAVLNRSGVQPYSQAASLCVLDCVANQINQHLAKLAAPEHTNPGTIKVVLRNSSSPFSEARARSSSTLSCARSLRSKGCRSYG